MDVRLAVGVPNSGSVKVDTVRGLISLVGELGGELPLNFLFHGGCYVHKNRETLVKQAIEYNYTHLLFVDTDMVWEAGSAKKLLDAKKPIIGANYNERRLPLRSTVKVANKKDEIIAYDTSKFPDKPVRVHSIATGFMLIDLSIMKDVPKPWFFFDTKEGEFNMGEDIWFCEQVKKAGYDIWCEPTIKIGHIGEYRY